MPSLFDVIRGLGASGVVPNSDPDPNNGQGVALDSGGDIQSLFKQMGPVDQGPVWSTANPGASGAGVMAPKDVRAGQDQFTNAGLMGGGSSGSTPPPDQGAQMLEQLLASGGAGQQPPMGGTQGGSSDMPGGTQQDPQDPHNLSSIAQELSGAMTGLGNIKQKPPVNAASRFGTKDLLTGLLPFAIMMLSGRKGQQLGGSFAQGFLQGKQGEAQTKNQANQTDYENQFRAQQAKIQGLTEQYNAARQQAMFEAQHGPTSKEQLTVLQREDESARKGIDSKDYGESSAGMEQQRNVYIKSMGILGHPWTDEQINARRKGFPVDDIRTGQFLNLKVKTQKELDQDAAIQIANKYAPLLNDIKVNDNRTKGLIDRERLKEMPARATAYIKHLHDIGEVDAARAELIGVTAALLPKEFQQKVLNSEFSMNRNIDIDNLEWNKFSEAQKNDRVKAMTEGITAISGEITSLDGALKTMQPQLTQEDDPQGDYHQRASATEARIAQLTQGRKSTIEKLKPILDKAGRDISAEGTVTELTDQQKKMRSIAAAAGKQKAPEVKTLGGYQYTLGSDGQWHRGAKVSGG